MAHGELWVHAAVLSLAVLAWLSAVSAGEGAAAPPQVGAYYFDGWAGRNAHADDPNEPWARNAPTHLSRRMVEEFAGREPIWGWRDDSQEVMERQIDLAADHGLAYFAFCWYWHDNGKPINAKAITEDSKHLSMELFLKARNSKRMKFCLLIANHAGHEIKGTEAWKQAADFWMPYLKHPQHLTVGGKPLLIIFDARGGDKEGFAYLQEAAKKAGLPGVALAACGGGPTEMGYTLATHYNTTLGYTAGSEEHKYAELVQHNEKAWRGRREQPYIPVLTAGWDKRPWEGPKGLAQKSGYYFPDRTPEQFAGFVRDMLAWMEKNPEQTTAERIALIYAWNELGEGGYLAPTKADPEGKYLKALKAVLAEKAK
jgi:hypothetical protein